MGVITRQDLVIEDDGSLPSSNQTLNIPRTDSEESLGSQLSNSTQPDVQILRKAIQSLHIQQRYTDVKQPGRRKLRRIKNLLALTTLVEEDEEDSTIKIPHNSSFGIILSNSDARKVWEEFNSLDEADQYTFLGCSPDRRTAPRPRTLNTAGCSWGAFFRISSLLKYKLKKLECADRLHALEQEVLAFFQRDPCGTMVKDGLTRSQSCFAQAITQYYVLSFGYWRTDCGMSVKIWNSLGEPLPSYEESLHAHVVRRFNVRH